MPSIDALSPSAATKKPPLRERLELPAIIALAICGGGVGYSIVRVGGLGPSEFTTTGEFRLWLFLNTAQTAMWALATVALVRLLRSRALAASAQEARSSVMWTVAVASVPTVGFTLAALAQSNLSYPLPHHDAKLLVLNLLGSAVALAGVAVLARVHFALRHDAFEATAAGVSDYLRLRAVLQQALAIEGAILGAAILAAGALRNVVVAWHNGDDSTYPPEYVLLWGTFFTLLLALLYAPIYRRLLETGRRLVESSCPLEDPTSPDWLAAYEKRKRLEELLQLGITTSASFRSLIAITAPLASSIASLLIGAA
jgi:hypothetical protein